MSKKYDVCAIGNALVDYEIEVAEEFFGQHNVEKGLMTLVDQHHQNKLAEAVKGDIRKKQSGGSAANTIFGLSQFGGKGYYTCKVANDEDGHVFMSDMESNGIDTNLDASHLLNGTTGKCLVMISPDADRTMSTFLGITTDFSENDLRSDAISNASYLYMEGYLVSSDTGIKAMKKAKEIAEKSGVKVSLTFSDPAMVKYFRDQMAEVIDYSVDLLFCNEEEAMLYTKKDSVMEAKEELKKSTKQFVVTEGDKGATMYNGSEYIKIEPFPVTAVDTTGAGDMFAGAFLYGITHGKSNQEAGKLASLASSIVVGKFGPRLENNQIAEILSRLN